MSLSPYSKIPLKDGVRAILEQAQFNVIPITIEVNRTLEIPVDFVADTNGHRFVIKCLENPENFDATSLEKLVTFAQSKEIHETMLIGDGVFSPPIIALVESLPVRLTERNAYHSALEALPQEVTEKLQPTSAQVIVAKSAFDPIPTSGPSAKTTPTDPSSESYSTTNSTYGTISRPAPPATVSAPPVSQKSSSGFPFGALIALAAVALYLGYTKFFSSSNAPEVVAAKVLKIQAEVEEKERKANQEAIKLSGSISNTIAETRKAAGLQTRKADTATVDLVLSQLGSVLRVGDDVTQRQLEQLLLIKNPNFQLESSTLVEADSPTELVAKVKSWPSISESENLQFGNITRNGGEGKVWTWVFNGKQADREEKLNQALSKGGDFSLKCSHCSTETGYKLTAHAKFLVIPTCSNCRLATHVFGPDTEGNYRRACDFLTGFQIPKVKVEKFLPKNEAIREPKHHVLAHWKAILDRCDYEYDSTHKGNMERDLWKLPQQTWSERAGDCEDTSILLADALISAGYEARVAFGTWEGEGHAWCVVKVGGRQRILETTMAHTGAVSLWSIIDMGNEYIATCMFDRDSIYLRRNASNLSTPDYFSETYWREMKINRADKKQSPAKLSKVND